LLCGIVQNGLLLVGKFYGVVYFGCTVCYGDSFRALRERYYRLDTKNITSSKNPEKDEKPEKAEKAEEPAKKDAAS